MLAVLVTVVLVTVGVNCGSESNFRTGTPGIAVNQKLKFILLPRERFCLYQHLESGYNLGVEANIISSDPTQTFGFDVQTESKVIFPFSLRKEFHENAKLDDGDVGNYAFCFENTYHWRKAVIEFSIQCFNTEELGNYFRELTELHVASLSIPETYIKVMKNIVGMGLSVSHRKQNILQDEALAEANFNYVNRKSLFQCFIILTSGVAQVFLYRKLFNSPLLTKTGKVRA